jgi:hypothetical protein
VLHHDRLPEDPQHLEKLMNVAFDIKAGGQLGPVGFRVGGQTAERIDQGFCGARNSGTKQLPCISPLANGKRARHTERGRDRLGIAEHLDVVRRDIDSASLVRQGNVDLLCDDFALSGSTSVFVRRWPSSYQAI